MSEAPYGILLTGGTSSRMGSDKAVIELDGKPLARRVASALAAATALAVEVGPGTSGLPSVVEDPPGSGPLAAVAAGWEFLVRRGGDKRPVLVLACDLPEVPAELVAWLAERPGEASVVPVLGGVPQPLCARWAVDDLERAAAQWAGGERSLRRVFGPSAAFVEEDAWGSVAPRSALEDVDTPDDLARRGMAPPPTGDDWIGLSRLPLPTGRAQEWVTLPSTGAVVTFAGTVRDHAEGREGVEELRYESYEAPALERMRAVVAEARRLWPNVGRVAVVHRLGTLAVGDTAVVVVVSSPHRRDAFEAGSWVIDTVKETVPIWKHERWADGEDWGTGAQPVRSV